MPRGNPSPKLAITIDPDIHRNVLAAAARDGVSVSEWMTSAAREALRRRAGLAAAWWERQHGPFTAEEMGEARRTVRAQSRASRTVRRPAREPSSITPPFSWQPMETSGGPGRPRACSCPRPRLSWQPIETSGGPGLSTRSAWSRAFFHWFLRPWSLRSADPNNNSNSGAS